MATTELVVRDRPLQVEMKPSRLLSLPKELRLQIWRYTVTDPSTENLVLRIRQGLAPCSQVEQPASKRICNPLLQQPRFHSVVETMFERPPNSSISVAILRSNKAIYHEALPILFDSIIFSPCSMFHEFLVSLSDFAKQHIRAVRLSPDYYLATASHFDWAVLCAQVASLPCLQRVEIKSEHVHIWQRGRITKRLMRPLLKIKVPKTLVPARDSGAFQKTLIDIKEEMDIERAARRERREAQAAEEAQRKQGDNQEEPAAVESKGVDQPSRIPEALRAAIANNLQAQDGSENDADEWDVVSVHNFAAGEENEQPITTGSKRPRSNSGDEHSPLLGYNDWELIEPDQSSDDSCK